MDKLHLTICGTELLQILILITMMPAVVPQDFNPTLFVRCINGFLGVSIRTPSGFNGIVYADGHRSECSTLGTGTLETTINIPLTAISRCGLTYDEETEQYFLLLHVREHPMIILQQDRTFNVSCPVIKRESTNTTASDPTAVQMGIFGVDGDKKLHKTLFGGDYSVKIWSSADEDFMITSCMGFAGYNYSLSLTDHTGCSSDTEIMSNFVYAEETNMAVAQLYSMFKFPSHDIIHLQCAVVFCAPSCRRTDCERRRDDPIPGIFNEAVQSEKLIQERFASTTVTVAAIENKTEIRTESTCGYHHHLLAALCILFGCLFLAALCVNCIFCALTGYCCCTVESQSDKDSVQYVTTDLKAIDALHSTAVRQYPALPYGHQLALPPFYYQDPVAQAQKDSWEKIYAMRSVQSQKSPTSQSHSSDSIRSERPLIEKTNIGGKEQSNQSRVPPPVLPRPKIIL